MGQHHGPVQGRRPFKDRLTDLCVLSKDTGSPGILPQATRTGSGEVRPDSWARHSSSPDPQAPNPSHKFPLAPPLFILDSSPAALPPL